MNDKRTFESCLERISEITSVLSSGNTELEESVSLYREANELLSRARNLLAEAEVKVAGISGGAEE